MLRQVSKPRLPSIEARTGSNGEGNGGETPGLWSIDDLQTAVPKTSRTWHRKQNICRGEFRPLFCEELARPTQVGIVDRFRPPQVIEQCTNLEDAVQT
jgi:hypothetical protein